MGGVDRGDQLQGYYSCCTKSRKFYEYIFYFLLDVAITNAFVLYKDYAGSPRVKTIRDFRVELAKELIGDYCSRCRAGRRESVLHNLCLRHFPVKLVRDDPSRRNMKRCSLCPCSISVQTPAGTAGSAACPSATREILQAIVSCFGTRTCTYTSNTLHSNHM